VSKLIGPFTQLLTMKGLNLKGSLKDEQLEILSDAGIVSDSEGKIMKIGSFGELSKEAAQNSWTIDRIEKRMVAFPGLVDCHTHLCWGGSRARDYAMRIAGKSYIEIAKQGGGILDTVRSTRAASNEILERSMLDRCAKLLKNGVTTVEVKSGYGLNKDEELRHLKVIQSAGRKTKLDVVSTCLSAHMKPHDFNGTQSEYLKHCAGNILPEVKAQNLSKRVDIFVEESAFSIEEARVYLEAAKKLGFELTLHVDQFTAGSSLLAVELGAKSADHLEASTQKEIEALAKSNTVAVALPGASLGLGCSFTPARKLLDQGATLAIASDWNPGSAPMGDLLTQAAIFGTYQKLSTAETFAALTFRAAKALGLEKTIGSIEEKKQCDLTAFPADDYRQVLYHQGQLRPAQVWKKGEQLHD